MVREIYDTGRQPEQLVESRGLAHLVVALGEVRRAVGCGGVETRSELEISVLLVEMGGNRVAPRDVRVDLSEGRQSRWSAVSFAHGDGTVEPDDRSVGELEQLVVPLDDLHPVGLLETRRIGVERGDRRLRLGLAEPVARERRLQHGDSLGDECLVPEAPILVGERDDLSVWSGAAVPARVVQQHQCEQPVHVGVVRDLSQLPGESDRLGGQIDVARVALVEDEVQHLHHRSHVARTIETGPADRALCATDALRHRALRHEVGLRDLPRGEAANSPEGERHG